MFQPQWWGIGQAKLNPMPEKGSEVQDSDSDTDGINHSAQREIKSYNPEEEDEDIVLERETVAKGERDSAALVIKNITKKFKKFVAVDDVSFSVKKIQRSLYWVIMEPENQL